MPHDYEVIARETNDHRPGWLSLAIDGVDADVCCDPGSFAKRAARIGAERGMDPASLAVFIGEYSREAATRALNRKADRIRAGRLKTGVSSSERISEETAVERFLNRGILKGLSKAQRIDRRKRFVERKQVDLQAEWWARRRALIATRKEQLSAAIADQKSNPARAHKIQKTINKLESDLADLEAATIVALTHGFQYAYGQVWTANVDLVDDDIRAVPCMTSTNADTVRDAVDACSDLTLDEFDGANYSTGGIALANQAVNIDDANDRAEFDCDDFPDPAANYGAGTREIEGLLFIKWITDLNGSLPLHWNEPTSNWSPDGSAFQWLPGAEGILQMADG